MAETLGGSVETPFADMICPRYSKMVGQNSIWTPSSITDASSTAPRLVADAQYGPLLWNCILEYHPEKPKQTF
jgi:hypothetical protein